MLALYTAVCNAWYVVGWKLFGGRKGDVAIQVKSRVGLVAYTLWGPRVHKPGDFDHTRVNTLVNT